jgi:nucleotide-binding universal stress UspA family protein
MFRTILVPLDGSTLSESALPYAEDLARGAGARLLLVRAVRQVGFAQAAGQTFSSGLQQAVRGAQAGRYTGDERPEEAPDALIQVEDYLRRVATALAERGVHTDILPSDQDAATAILDGVSARDVDLVAMATHGRSGLGRWVYGSVAERVLAHCPVPLLLVRAWTRPRALVPPGGPARVLVPLDGSDFAQAALPVAIRLAQQLGGDVLLAQVVSVPREGLLEDAAAAHEREAAGITQAEYSLRQLADRLALEHPGVAFRVTARVDEHPPDGIAAAAALEQATVMVMSTHGRTGLGRALLGSVAGGLVRQEEMPLVLVRPEQMRLAVAAAATE